MKIKEITKDMKGSTIAVEGFVTKKEETMNGEKAILLTMREQELVLFSRVRENNANLYQIASRLKSGAKVEIVGELKQVKGEDKINFISPDEISLNNETRQIIRLDARNSFVEFMADAFEIDKVKINFIQYDASKEVGSRTTSNISIYMDLGEARVFCRRILNGYYDKKIAEEKNKKEANPSYYYQSVMETLGGTSAKTLATRNQSRLDGKSLSRSFSVEVSTIDSVCYCLIGKCGPGNENEKGLIVPCGKAEQTVRIPLTKNKAEELALTLKDHIAAYTASKY